MTFRGFRRSASHAAGIPISAKPAGSLITFEGATAIAQHRHNLLTGPASCLPDLAPGQGFGAAAATGARRFRPTSHVRDRSDSGIKLLTGNAVFTTTRQALSSLFSNAWLLNKMPGLGEGTRPSGGCPSGRSGRSSRRFVEIVRDRLNELLPQPLEDVRRREEAERDRLLRHAR